MFLCDVPPQKGPIPSTFFSADKCSFKNLQPRDMKWVREENGDICVMRNFYFVLPCSMYEKDNKITEGKISCEI